MNTCVLQVDSGTVIVNNDTTILDGEMRIRYSDWFFGRITYYCKDYVAIKGIYDYILYKIDREYDDTAISVYANVVCIPHVLKEGSVGCRLESGLQCWMDLTTS